MIRPVGETLLIEKVEMPLKSGLILAEGVITDIYSVLDAGDYGESHCIHKGDRIIINRRSAQEVDRNTYIVRIADVLSLVAE